MYSTPVSLLDLCPFVRCSLCLASFMFNQSLFPIRCAAARVDAEFTWAGDFITA